MLSKLIRELKNRGVEFVYVYDNVKLVGSRSFYKHNIAIEYGYCELDNFYMLDELEKPDKIKQRIVVERILQYVKRLFELFEKYFLDVENLQIDLDRYGRIRVWKKGGIASFTWRKDTNIIFELAYNKPKWRVYIIEWILQSINIEQLENLLTYYKLKGGVI